MQNDAATNHTSIWQWLFYFFVEVSNMVVDVCIGRCFSFSILGGLDTTHGLLFFNQVMCTSCAILKSIISWALLSKKKNYFLIANKQKLFLDQVILFLSFYFFFNILKRRQKVSFSYVIISWVKNKSNLKILISYEEN